MSKTLVITVFIVLIILSLVRTQNVTVYPADSFADSIGVNTHWAYPNVYINNYTGLKSKLAESGIRYVRDGTFPNVFLRLNDLYNSLGVKTNLITSRWKSGPWPQPLDPEQIDVELNDVKNQTLAAIVSLEAPNEYDVSHGPDTDWIGTIKTYSSSVYAKAKADQLLKNIPIIGPSLTTLEAYQAVGNSDPYIDQGNQHIYQWTYWPGFSGYDANGTRSITWYLDELGKLQSPSGKPVQATETGYTNFVDIGGLSEEADGKYMARIFAEFFRRGIYRTYKYEFVNQAIPGREGFFGLLRNDLTEKPSFRAVSNLIHIFNDKGPTFLPTPLSYTLSGTTDDVRQILFQKRDGDYYLMVWLEVSCWNVTQKVDLYPPPLLLSLNLPTENSISNAILYALNNTGDVNIVNLPITNNQVIFNATDKISVIKLSSSTMISIARGVYRLLPKNALHSALSSNGKRNDIAVIREQHWTNINQQWIIEPNKDEFYHIINRGTSQPLKLNRYFDCQKWKIEPLPNFYYRVVCQYGDNQLINESQQWKLEWIT